MENNAQPDVQAAEKTYLVKQNEWFIEDEADETLGIETFKADDGAIRKRVKLSDGRVAECRRLKGKDTSMINRISNGKPEKVQQAVAAFCTKIDGKELIMEDLEGCWFNDYTKIVSMSSSINFL